MNQEMLTASALNIVNVILEEINSSDEEENNNNVVEKNENFVEVTIQNFTDQQFKEHFRICPTTLEVLLQKLHASDDNLPVLHKGQPEVSLEKQTLIMLWCLANVECFRSIADRFGIAKSTCWNILYRNAQRLLKMNEKYKIISFPTPEECMQIMQEFEQISGFPGVVGAIDGCHIRIEKPSDYPNSYINRKGFPSIILQGVCDNKKLFRDVYVGQPGSLHDARVLSKSVLWERIGNNEIEFPNDGHLIGDLAYGLNVRLLVGFKDNGHLNGAQRLYNTKLSKSRVVIENAFGLLKCRFRRLKMMETKKLPLICLLVMSACILHNICITNGDHFEGALEQDDIIDNNNAYNENIQDRLALVKRNNIVNHLQHLH